MNSVVLLLVGVRMECVEVMFNGKVGTKAALEVLRDGCQDRQGSAAGIGGPWPMTSWLFEAVSPQMRLRCR